MRSLAIYLAVVMVGGAAIAPWLHALMQWLASHYPILQHWAESPFHRYVNRSMQGLAILGLIPFLRSIQCDSWKGFGLSKTDRGLRNAVRGAFLGLISIILIAGPALLWQARLFKTNSTTTLPVLLENMAQAALSGVGVGVLEEIIFRGALFNALRRAHHWTLALTFSSFLYALLHFFQKPLSPEAIHWNSGFITIFGMFKGFADLEMLIPGFFVLTLAGYILGLLYQDTGSLYASIGLHASWVFFVKIYASVTYARPEASAWFWGSKKLTDGWIGFLVLALLLGCLMVWRQRRDKQSVT